MNVTSALYSSNVTSPSLPHLMGITQVGNSTNNLNSSSGSQNTPSTSSDSHSNVESSPKIKYMYPVRGDGACFFRAHLANKEKDPSWLSDRPISDVYTWIKNNQGVFRTAFTQAITSLRDTNTHSVSERILLENILSINENNLLTDDLLTALMNENELMLWREDAVKYYLSSLFSIQLPNDVTNNLISGIYQSLAEQLDVPLNQNKDVYLKRTGSETKGYHYVLYGPNDLFGNTDVENEALYERRIYKPIDDGASFLRSYLAAVEKNTQWLKTKSTNEVYLWVEKNKDTFESAILSAIPTLKLDSFFTSKQEAERTKDFFTSSSFLERLMRGDKCGLFDPSEIRGFAEESNIKISEKATAEFVNEIIKNLSQKWDMKEGDDGFYYVGDDLTIALDQTTDTVQYYYLIDESKTLKGNVLPDYASPSSSTDYHRLKYKQDETLARFAWVNKKDETLYLSWLALTHNLPDDLGSGDIGLALSNSRTFAICLSNAIYSSLNANTIRTTHTKTLELSKYILENYFKKDFFDLNVIFNDLLEGKHKTVEDLQKYSNTLINIKEDIEERLVEKLGFKLIAEKDMDTVLPGIEFFVKEGSGQYSFVTNANHFIPESTPQKVEPWNTSPRTTVKPLFTTKDAVKAGISLFIEGSNYLNRAAQDYGFNIEPRARRVPSDDTQKENVNEEEINKEEVSSINLNETLKYKTDEGDKNKNVTFKAQELNDTSIQNQNQNQNKNITTAPLEPSTEQERGKVRKKRRAGTNADPNDFFALNIDKFLHGEAVDAGAPVVYKLDDLNYQLDKPLPTDLNKRRKRTEKIAFEINQLRASNRELDLFFRNGIDMYVTRYFDTHAETRNAYTYYKQRHAEGVASGLLYVDKDINKFYEAIMRPSYDYPDGGISGRVDQFSALLLLSKKTGIPLDAQMVGLAWAELSTLREISNLNLERSYIEEIETMHELSTRRSPRLYESIASSLDDDFGYKAVIAPFSRLMSDAAPLTDTGQGICHVSAIAAAMEMTLRTGGSPFNVENMGRILGRTQEMYDLSSGDTSSSQRILEGLTRYNEELYAQTHRQLSRGKYFVDLPDLKSKLLNAKTPIVLTVRDAGLENPHSFTVAPVLAPRRSDPRLFTTSYLVWDSNFGAIPCVTIESALEMVNISIKRYYGWDDTNAELGTVRMSALVMTEALVKQLDFDNQGGASTGPHLKLPGTNNQISYKHFFSGEYLDFEEFGRTHPVSKHASWKEILPSGLGKRKTEGKFGTPEALGGGRKAFLPKNDGYLKKLHALISGERVKCLYGTCSSDISDYDRTPLLESEEAPLGTKNKPQTSDEQLYAKTRRKVKIPETQFDDEAYERAPTSVDDIEGARAAKSKHPRDRYPVETRRNPDDTDLPVVPKRNPDNSPPQRPDKTRIKSPADPNSIPQHIKLMEDAAQANLRTHANNRGMQSLIPEIKVDGAPPPLVPRRREQTTSGSRSPLLDASSSTDRNLLKNVGDLLSGARALDEALEGASPLRTSPLKRGAAMKGNRSPGGGARSRLTPGNPSPNQPLSGAHSPNQPLSGALSPNQRSPASGNTSPRTRRTQAEALGNELINRLQRMKTEDTEYGLSGKFRVFPSQSFETEPLMGAYKRANELISLFETHDDPEIMRHLLVDSDNLEIRRAQTHSLVEDIGRKVKDLLKKRGHDPDQWEAIPSKKGQSDNQITFVSKSKGKAQQYITIELPEYLTQRLKKVRQNIVTMTSKIKNSKLSKGVLKIAHSQRYKRTGRILGGYSKLMNLVSMYHLFSDVQGLQDMQGIHALALRLTAMDVLGDFAANALSFTNKAYKLLHQGAPHLSLQATAQMANRLSSIAGLTVSLTLSITHIYALCTVETDFEYEIASANLAFAITSTVLASIGLAFPLAAPLMAIAGLLLAGIQMIVLEAIKSKEMYKQAKERLTERFKDTEKLLEIVKVIAHSNLDDVIVGSNNGDVTVTIKSSASSAQVEITSEGIRLIHQSDSFSFTLFDNSIVQMYIAKQVLTACASKNDPQCNTPVPPRMLANIKKSNLCFPNGMARSVEPTKKRSYYLKPRWKMTDSLVSCLFMDQVIKDNPSMFKARMKRFLKRKVDFDTKAAASKKTIMINEIYPKLSFNSDLSAWDEYYEQHSWPTLNLTRKVTNQHYTAPKPTEYVYSQVCDEVAKSVPGLTKKDVCVANPKIDWEPKSSYLEIKPEKDCDGNDDKKAELMIGLNIVVVKSPGSRQSFLNVVKRHITAPVGSVILKPAGTKIIIDINKEDEASLVVLPEMHSTNFLNGRSTHFVVEDKVHSKKITYAIDEHTNSFIKSLPEYNIYLKANSDNKIHIGLGTKTKITEENSSEGTREGAYIFQLFITETLEMKNAALESAKIRKERAENIIRDHGSKIKQYESEIAKYKTEKRKLHANEYNMSYEDDRRMDELKFLIGMAENNILEMKKSMMNEEYQLPTLIRLYEAEKNIDVFSVNQLKSKVRLSEDQNGKHLYVLFNVGQRSEFGRAQLKINDIKRPVYLQHIEHVTANEKEEKIPCEFDIKTEDKLDFKLTRIQSIPYCVTNEMTNLVTSFREQLKNNNPELDFEKNMIVTNLDMTDTDPDLFGDVHKFVNLAESANEGLDAVSNKNLTGYSMILNMDTAKPTLVNIIFPNDLDESTVTMLKNLDYLGSESIHDESEVPHEYLALYRKSPKEDRKFYYLYDPVTYILIKQCMNAPIRFFSDEDISICLDDSKPEKFERVSRPPVYACASPSEVNLSHEIVQCNNEHSGRCPDLFQHLLTLQETKNLPKVLTLINPGIRDPKTKVKKSILMEFIKGETKTPFLLALKIDDPEAQIGIITRNTDEGYALLGEKVTTSDPEVKKKLDLINARRAQIKLKPMSEIQLSILKLIEEEELIETGKTLVSRDIETFGVPESILKTPRKVLEGFHITTIQSDRKSGFICESIEGVAFGLSKGLDKTDLVGLNADYLNDHHVNTTNSDDLRKAFSTLTMKYGEPKGTYVRMSDGIINDDGSSEPMIFMDSIYREPLYIPRTDQTSQKAYIVGSLYQSGSTTQLTVVDHSTKNLVTIGDPGIPQEAYQMSSLAFNYFQLLNNKAYLSLKDTGETQRELSYLPVERLVLLPQFGVQNATTPLEIPLMMQQQIKILTLVSKREEEEETQKINMSSDEGVEMKVFIYDAGDNKEIYLAVAKKTSTSDGKKSINFISGDINALSSKYLFVHLNDALSQNGTLNNEFDNAISVNGKPVSIDDLNQLLSNATKLTL